MLAQGGAGPLACVGAGKIIPQVVIGALAALDLEPAASGKGETVA